ncbi:sugar ABC transporter ATP-binding protein [Anaerobium acetethylicum]|uniref:Ribose transport system ATP-binding protein n=1 Tax=Anaerobium acetethylicum TaxID=1619234 RepID=A0A1D3TYW1_9FIRM|nr:sugar ABC transporter ATP-binding protein [Anaerobium acetethylicum]SCP99652.1 ribose transport system ATP-binding protein [Anaerobium acetethylicum]
MSKTILRAEGVSKSFGGTLALDNAELELRSGEVHALVGANGAGKSTLIKIITGAYSKDEGHIYLEDKEINVKSTFEARELGISAVYQEFSLINTLSVAENIYLGKLISKKHGPVEKIQWQEIIENAKKILDMLESDISPNTIVGSLSVAQKQLVEIAKALSNDIKVLIMDEPSASLSDNDIENMFKLIKGLKEKGIGIVYVSHRLEELPIIADRISVYRDGKYIKTLNIDEAPKKVIIENMVGPGMVETKRTPCSTSEVLMEVQNFSSGKKFKNISFQLHKGEVLGIAGLAGAGRTELVRAIFGVDSKDSGKICIHGKETVIRNPADAKKAGIGFISEDRKEEGLILNLPLHTNLGMTILDKLKRFIGLDLDKEVQLMDDYISSLKIKCRDSAQKAGNLSGGNQQKVVIAKWLATKPEILIMDEPTRGIDIGSKNQIYDLIDDLAKQGIGIIMISSELPEVLQVSDRIIVLAAGKKTGEIENKELTQDILLDYATRKQAV